MTGESLLRILLVDDEDSFRLSIEMALKMTDQFSVRSCNSGEAALDILQQEQFDVILLDNKMDDMSGLDVLRWMQSQEIPTPAIMITAAGSESVAVEAMKLGAFDYLRKDQLDIDRLRMAIRSVRERYLYRRQAMAQEAEKRLLTEKQGELDSLRLFHNTVNSVGQLLEKNLVDLQRTLSAFEEGLVSALTDEGKDKFHEMFGELHKNVEIISSGVSSMRNLSSVITHRLDEINIVPQTENR